MFVITATQDLASVYLVCCPTVCIVTRIAPFLTTSVLTGCAIGFTWSRDRSEILVVSWACDVIARATRDSRGLIGIIASI